MMKNQIFRKGIRGGFPIGIAYFIVSFGFGITAVRQGLSPLTAVLMSLTSLTSAGQVAGVGIIVSGGSFFEMALTQFTINARYLLMGISLSQKLDDDIAPIHRFLMPCAVTDEIFGVASAEPGKIRPALFYGLMLLPYVGWGLGTFLGSFVGSVLPQTFSDALGIAIYGMFIAIILPPARKDRGIFATILIAIFLSCAFSYLPVISKLSGGFSLIICAVVASVIAAFLFPTKEETEAAES